VVGLVKLSDEIRRDRRNRLRELEWERQEHAARERERRMLDSRFYEREVVIDRRR
jgi:hypothetical protein